jgi:hypothetical protein
MTTRIEMWIVAFASTALMAVLSGCSSGGQGDGDGITPPPPASRTVVTMGPISGFGSVYVNGVRYATADTDIEIDGVKASLSDLRVGQVIDLKGKAGDGSATADFIRYSHNLEGPVTSVDAPALRFVAMGQTVLVGSDTSFGEGVSLDGLVVGDIVEVSGLVNAEGQIEATRVDLWSGSGPYDVFGTVSGLNAVSKTFFITGLHVDYSTANVEDFPSGGPANGDLVLATGFEFGALGEFVATRIELRHDQAMMPKPGNTLHVEGLVTRFASATDFDVADIPVTTTASTVYEGGTVADLALDVRVCVEGTVNIDGVLAANRIRFRPENEIRIVSATTAINLAAKSLTALGLVVTTDTSTRFEDDDAGIAVFDLTGLHTGDWVDVRGYEYPADSGKVYATRVERIDEQTLHQMRGPFRNPDPPSFNILTVAIMTTVDTRFVLETNVDAGAGAPQGPRPESPPGMPSGTQIDPAVFFAQPPGTIVEARGAWSGTVLTATRAIIKTCDD